MSDAGRSGPVSRETQKRIGHFLLLLEKWSRTTNLIARSTLGDVARRHVADSLQLLDLVPAPAHWIDLGSGAGFPGLILAIAFAEQEAGWVDLVESNRKKAGFLRLAIAETGARATVHPMRIETVGASIGTCDHISARALAPLDHLFSFAEPWFQSNPACQAWFHKGRDYQKELDKARGSWRFDLVEHQSSVGQDSFILQIENLERL